MGNFRGTNFRIATVVGVPDNCPEQSGSCFIVKSDNDASVRQVSVVLHRTTPAMREGLYQLPPQETVPFCGI